MNAFNLVVLVLVDVVVGGRCLKSLRLRCFKLDGDEILFD